MPDTPRTIPLTPSNAPVSGEVHRRSLLQLLLGGLGATAVPGGAAAQHPMLEHLGSAVRVEQAQSNAAAASYQPQFLDAHQLRTLESLAEAIVPGSTAARVAPFLDQLLAVDAARTQRDFVGALGAFDMAAIQRHGRAWAAITAADQHAILTQASTADPKALPLAAHFVNLKTWIAGAYYSSEPGMRELGWTGEFVHPELPRCTHSGGHA